MQQKINSFFNRHLQGLEEYAPYLTAAHTKDISQEGIGHTVTVDDFANGDNVRGVRQLAGNVWEWTDDDLLFSNDAVESSVDLGLKSLRGGAFDTYLESQASCDPSGLKFGEL